MAISCRALRVSAPFLVFLVVGCSAPGEPEEEDAAILEMDPFIAQNEAGLSGYCVAYQHTNRQGQQLVFAYPMDYNDLHRKPDFGDTISSIECFGASLVVWQHVQWAGAPLVVGAGAYIANLHAFAMGDKISSVRWAGEESHAGSCTVYEHVNYQGGHYTFSNRQDYNDLHRMGWGDTISSYQCTQGVGIALCQQDRWGACKHFWQSDPNLHDNGYGDNISSITW